MDYLIMSDLNSRIAGAYLIQALDDDQDGVADPAVFAQIQADVKTAVHGPLAGRYTVPFNNPLPDVVKLAAQVFACEMLYNRRGVTGDKNPWAKQADDLRAQLKAIGKGEQPLTPEIARAKPSATIISETSKATSTTGKLP